MSGPKNAAADGKGAAAAPPPMPDGRIQFDDEQYALLQTRPTHAEYKRLFKISTEIAVNPLAEALDGSNAAVETLLIEWRIRDRDGVWLAKDAESIERCPADLLMPIFQRCIEIFRATPTPKA